VVAGSSPAGPTTAGQSLLLLALFSADFFILPRLSASQIFAPTRAASRIPAQIAGPAWISEVGIFPELDSFATLRALAWKYFRTYTENICADAFCNRTSRHLTRTYLA
jgi:hypothetical protein